MGLTDNSSFEEADDEPMEEEYGEPEGHEHEETEEQEGADPKLPSSGVALEEGKRGSEVRPWG